jgi:hypothetical protein
VVVAVRNRRLCTDFFACARRCAQACVAVGVDGGVVGLELGRGSHRERRVQAVGVVVALDELEDRRAQFGAGGPSSLRRVGEQQFLGQGCEERLGDGVRVRLRLCLMAPLGSELFV